MSSMKDKLLWNRYWSLVISYLVLVIWWLRTSGKIWRLVVREGDKSKREVELIKKAQ
jgi:hypothetical protein